MFSRRKVDALVERVLRRLTEAPVSYGQTEPAPPMAPTQFPSSGTTAKTIPAARSAAEREANKELAGKDTRNPKAAPMSQKTMKVNAVRKQLDAMGWTAQHGVGERDLNQSLSTWYDTLDPSDALVSTAQELAQRWAQAER